MWSGFIIKAYSDHCFLKSAIYGASWRNDNFEPFHELEIDIGHGPNGKK